MKSNLEKRIDDLLEKDDEWARKYSQDVLEGKGFKVEVDGLGNLIARRGEPKIAICAHVDYVHSQCKKMVQVKKGHGITFGSQSFIMQDCYSVGVDDRVGMGIALHLAENIKGPLMVVFFEEEETGGKGSREIAKEHFKGVTVAISADRRGNEDMVTSIYRDDLCGEEFRKRALEIGKEYKFRECMGMFTDVANLVTRKLVNNALNLSAGYYEPHTTEDYYVPEEAENTAALMRKLICTMPTNLAAPKDKPVYQSSLAGGYWMDNKWVRAKDSDSGWTRGWGLEKSYHTTEGEKVADNVGIDSLAVCCVCKKPITGRFTYTMAGMGWGYAKYVNRFRLEVDLKGIECICEECGKEIVGEGGETKAEKVKGVAEEAAVEVAIQEGYMV